MYKECYFKEFQLHFWFVILLFITNQNLLMQDKNQGINIVNSKLTQEISYSEKTVIATFQFFHFLDFQNIKRRSDSFKKKYFSTIQHLQFGLKTINNAINYKRISFFKLKNFSADFKTQNTSQANTNTQNVTRIRYDFIVISGLLFIILGLLFRLKKSKKKSHQILQSKDNEIGKRNEALNKLYAEKEWLLKELHHRVKNNLQIVISLLNTQSAYLENKDALLAIQDSQHRMNAMSLIYQKIYESENLEIIDMCWYIPELVNYLKGVFNTDKKISYKLDIECVDLDISKAIPLGLILNEAIINAIKYAYPETVQGEVNIRLKKIEDEMYQLIISDNGVGVPDHFELKNRNSLGMNLMHGLSSQVDGTFNIESKNGLTITINFKAKNKTQQQQ
ncbi:ATP-binding protein [Flavobacterium psychroterrae]|uniref:histidine kinase n=1 Tax=Flavobacterium psychroterrae TaxID=2133767 RepID=A0ABS5P5N9_9FLAO|nr:histidine kinase dimerization/phosphoacceptor domain -containing protein [Flavobacterium psychroterrae]MBS7229605.1 ATP-binding protein [Flavobacterium psychroterrae]